jgi:hypothetical protein
VQDKYPRPSSTRNNIATLGIVHFSDSATVPRTMHGIWGQMAICYPHSQLIKSHHAWALRVTNTVDYDFYLQHKLFGNGRKLGSYIWLRSHYVIGQGTTFSCARQLISAWSQDWLIESSTEKAQLNLLASLFLTFYMTHPSFHSVEALAPLRTYQSVDASYSVLCIGIW